jgi:hypothetical protein
VGVASGAAIALLPMKMARERQKESGGSGELTIRPAHTHDRSQRANGAADRPARERRAASQPASFLARGSPTTTTTTAGCDSHRISFKCAPHTEIVAERHHLRPAGQPTSRPAGRPLLAKAKVATTTRNGRDAFRSSFSGHFQLDWLHSYTNGGACFSRSLALGAGRAEGDSADDGDDEADEAGRAEMGRRRRRRRSQTGIILFGARRADWRQKNMAATAGDRDNDWVYIYT